MALWEVGIVPEREHLQLQQVQVQGESVNASWTCGADLPSRSTEKTRRDFLNVVQFISRYKGWEKLCSRRSRP